VVADTGAALIVAKATRSTPVTSQAVARRARTPWELRSPRMSHAPSVRTPCRHRPRSNARRSGLRTLKHAQGRPSKVRSAPLCRRHRDA
jgi:hypothetical protein